MKCPKCQYFSFDSGERCRNCGYDFSLSADAPAEPSDDLRIQTGAEALGPLADFSLNDTPNLPLFTREGGDPDAPLVMPSATPRVPLSVRRGAPTAPRPRQRKPDVTPEPWLALDTESPLDATPEPAAVPAPHQADAPREPDELTPVASVIARLGGGVIDVLLLGGIDLAVIYFTLRVLGLPLNDVLTLPAAPMVSFLLLLDGGYLSMFIAAGGQTIGKMAAGTRVVPADPAAPAHERVTFGQAVVRAGGYIVSALPVGLGFLPAFFGERRALHDRLADTRVVKA
jgi:uncharacterized RDD family membrane protein YckC